MMPSVLCHGVGVAGAGASLFTGGSTGNTHLVYRSGPPWLLHSHNSNRSFPRPLALGVRKGMDGNVVEWGKGWTLLLDSAPKLGGRWELNEGDAFKAAQRAQEGSQFFSSTFQFKHA